MRRSTCTLVGNISDLGAVRLEASNTGMNGLTMGELRRQFGVRREHENVGMLRVLGPRRFQEPRDACVLAHVLVGQPTSQGDHLRGRSVLPVPRGPREALEEPVGWLFDVLREFDGEAGDVEGAEVCAGKRPQEANKAPGARWRCVNDNLNVDLIPGCKRC